jgi:hypothetical protein
MTCEHVSFPGGSAIVCSGRRARTRCRCGNKATLLCDWKVTTRRPSGTCDKPICARCATSPAPDKDLCPDHAKAFAEWMARRV